MSSKFVHLHTHSHYSLLDGLSKVDELVKKAKEFEMPALAITDHGNLHGAIEFYMAAKKAGIKPIIGVEGYIANRTRFDKQPGIDNKRYHITLLAKNLQGYKNLIKLVTKSHLEGFYYKPRMDKDLLREHHEGLICLSGCMGGEFCRALWNNDPLDAERLAREYQEIFGAENFFLEVMHDPKLERMDEIKRGVIAMSQKLSIPLMATKDSHFLCLEDKRAHETLLSIQTDASNADASKFSFGEGDYSFINETTALSNFSECPEAVSNTLKVAEMCELEIEIGKFIFPEFKLEDGKTADEKLRELAEAGLTLRGLEGNADVLERLNYELEIIKFKGYAAYFLVVEDLIRFAHEHGIYTNIRGSVAGSMTTYLLGITKIDPLEYKIPFERFLNPERPSAPDIDMDFSDNRREEVLDYAKQKYGPDKVAQIGTFGTMLARGAVRDVARALEYPYQVGDRISKLIPLGSQGFPMTIDHALELEPELRKIYESEKDVREIIDLAKKLEGCVRHVSVHAAGVVIAPKALVEYVPLQFDPKGGKLITQYDMYTVGEDGIGLTKFDFLGIRNLTILANAVDIIKQYRGIEIDIETIPLDDKKTFAMLARGETVGLFQLNSDGMTKWLMELEPNSIHDINAMVALYRPGPLQFIPEFVKRKKNSGLIKYLDPALEPILKQTYGVLVYQDDLLIMAHDLAGYSWGEVDKFRKAVGKKIPAEMKKQKEKFIEGCMTHVKWPRSKAEEIWAWIEPFAAYGFNKAHSASYGRVAYQTAYLKANFPVEYMTAVLTAESGDVAEIAWIIDACKRMKIRVLPPAVNESEGNFAVVSNAAGKAEYKDIRFGLYTIKNLGQEIADAIINERKTHGAYASYTNFLERVHHRNLNKKSLEALIQAGAMDALGERGQMLFNLDDALAYNREGAHVHTNQTSLFGLIEDQATIPKLTLRPAEPARLIDKLSWEKELLGLYISGHPLEQFKERFKRQQKDIAAIKSEPAESVVILGGLIESVKTIFTKKNEHMAFLKVADFNDTIEVVVFPKTFSAFKELIVPDKCIALRGRLSLRKSEPSVIAESFKELTA